MSLEVKELSKQFYDKQRGEFYAVDSVTFSCQPGQIFGLLGPNGAGKTTTLRMIATILKPLSGTATIAGYDICTQPGLARRNLGFLSNDTGLYERFSPREILTYFGTLCKYPREKLPDRVNEVIGILGMKEFADTRCSKLSTGMKQKVSIARAIVHDPDVIVFDEPTTGLDVIATQSMHKLIRGCRDQNKCVVFSSHIMSEVEKLCDQIGIIHKGKLMALGTLAELRESTGEHYLEDIFLAIVKEPDVEIL